MYFIMGLKLTLLYPPPSSTSIGLCVNRHCLLTSGTVSYILARNVSDGLTPVKCIISSTFYSFDNIQTCFPVHNLRVP